MTEDHPLPPPDLAEILTLRASNAPAPESWPQADRALHAGACREAAELYAGIESPSPDERAKHGFCLGMIGDDAGAEVQLSEANVGPHPEALAMLAWVLGGSSGQRIRGGFKPEARRQAEERKARVKALFATALAAEAPPSFVFNALFAVLGTSNDMAETQAARARVLYPDWALPHAIVATQRRIAGEVDPEILDDMMRSIARARHEDVFREAYVHAMELSRWDDAARVVDVLERLIAQDEQAGDRNIASLAEMRAMVCLHRARAGERGAYQTVLDQIAPFVPEVQWVADGRDPTVAPKFMLQVALETGDDDQVREAATMLVERAWEANSHNGEGIARWSPVIYTDSLKGSLIFGHYGFDFDERSAQVEAALDDTMRSRWRLLMAADAMQCLYADQDQVALLRATSPDGLPWWICKAIYSAHVDHEPEDRAGAGAVLAALAERAASMPPSEDPRYPTALEDLSVEVDGIEDPVEVFSGALAWLQAHPTATGKILLKEWGSDLAEVEGGKAVLAELAALSRTREDSDIARNMQELAAEPDPPDDSLEDVLARYPQPESTRLGPQDLSLLEAATVIALLRACAIDHVRWTLAPLASAGQPFEPTKRFVGTLFALMDKGAIAIDSATPTGIVNLLDDGRLSAHLDRVVWRISANTLALRNAIRDLPRQHWPQTWRDHAPTLARDLGVEEMVAYLDFLLRTHSLPTPNVDEVRAVFRMQLEHLALAQCYYLAHKTMRETLAYQARYRVGRAQLEKRVINLLRGNGENAIAKGWDTRYQRIRDLPPSLLWEALHDVLTGWGRAAFDETVMKLSLDDPETPTTQH